MGLGASALSPIDYQDYMNKKKTLPPPPPPVVAMEHIQRLEELVFDLKRQMEQTNVRVRFKMSTYKQWCDKISSIYEEIRKLRGA